MGASLSVAPECTEEVLYLLLVVGFNHAGHVLGERPDKF